MLTQFLNFEFEKLFEGIFSSPCICIYAFLYLPRSAKAVEIVELSCCKAVTALWSAVVTVELRSKAELLKTQVSEVINPESIPIIDCRAIWAAVDTPDALLPKEQMRLLIADCKTVTKEVTVEVTAVTNVLEILFAAVERAVSNWVTAVIPWVTRVWT